MLYNYIITPRAVGQITQFYCNVALKYRHTYSIEDMERNIRQAVFSAYLIERGLARRVPTISRWEGKHMANANKWYYAYTIEGNDIISTMPVTRRICTTKLPHTSPRDIIRRDRETASLGGLLSTKLLTLGSEQVNLHCSR